MDCRHCAAPLDSAFLDLGTAPPSNAYLEPGDLARAEVFYPLKICVCGRCGLVQTHDIVDAGAMFNADYAYFSSVSASWLAHGHEAPFPHPPISMIDFQRFRSSMNSSRIEVV